jgi:membrane protease YdiL (CAAX protease family)
LIAAIATPLIFNFVVNWNIQSPNLLNTYFLHKGFVVFFERIRLLALFLFLPALWKIYRRKICQPTFKRLDYKIFRSFLALGVLLIGGIFAIKMLFLDFTLKAPSSFFLLRVLVGTLIIALTEEWLFRGLIFKLLLQKMRPLFATIWSALIFAYFHFRPPYALPTSHRLATFSDGFYCLYEVIFHSLAGISWFKFLIIFSFGYLLAMVYFYAQRLRAVIGLHVGVVFSLTIFKTCVSFPLRHPLFGSNDLFDSPLALSLIILTIALTHWIGYDSQKSNARNG